MLSGASVFSVTAGRMELLSGLLAVLPSDEALEYSLGKFHSPRLALSLGIPGPATVVA
jgi:hypothetical protein